MDNVFNVLLHRQSDRGERGSCPGVLRGSDFRSCGGDGVVKSVGERIRRPHLPEEHVEHYWRAR